MVQSLKCLLYKHEDLSGILSTHITCMVARAQNHSSGKAEIVDPWCLLTIQSSLVSKLQL